MTFSHKSNGISYLVSGYFAADGNARNKVEIEVRADKDKDWVALLMK
ncbi:MAG: hypothetical protein NWS46_04925 [Cyclobacteriaceae bacterium]|nr:hypothetical protein [Cyclobacteriaceae bacterium]